GRQCRFPEGMMRFRAAGVAIAIGIITGLAISTVGAQQAGKRNFDAEFRTALQSAKDAAGFEFFGTLARICLLPQSGGPNTQDNLPIYMAKPAAVPPRAHWYAATPR